jgi:hypothetical protein
MFAAPPASELSSDWPVFGLLILRMRLGEPLTTPPRHGAGEPPRDVPQMLTSFELLGLRAEPSPREEPLPMLSALLGLREEMFSCGRCSPSDLLRSREMLLNLEDAAMTSWSCGEQPEL